MVLFLLEILCVNFFEVVGLCIVGFDEVFLLNVIVGFILN